MKYIPNTKIDEDFLTELDEIMVGSSPEEIDNAERFQNREGFRNDDSLLEQLMASWKYYEKTIRNTA